MCDIKENNRKIYFWGDNHWNFNYIRFQLNKKFIQDAILIQVGDFGLGFHHINKELVVLEDLNNLLAENNVTLYVIRGNHDNPEYYQKQLIDMTNIKLLPDYTTICAGEHKILGIGGAVSIDSIIRTPGKTWWRNENVVYNDIIHELRDITIVATHTTINEAPPELDMKVPILEYYGLMQPWLEGDLRRERELLTQIYNELNENNNKRYWFYGHFHKTFTTVINDTTFYALNINEIKTI